jgi:hypothetical protein
VTESSFRREKKRRHEEAARALTPAQRLRRAAAMTAAGRKLKAAGRAWLESASLVRDAAPRARGK